MGRSTSRILLIGAVLAVALPKVPAFGKNVAPKKAVQNESADDKAAEPATKAKQCPQPGAKPAVSATKVSLEVAQEAPKKPTLFSHTSYPNAWTAAQQSNRPILLYVSMSGCHHCEKMMAESYRDANMEQMLVDSFETMYVTRNQHPALVKKLKVKWFPTTVIVGRNNKIMDVIEGYVDQPTLRRRLQTSLASTQSSVQTR